VSSDKVTRFGQVTCYEYWKLREFRGEFACGFCVSVHNVIHPFCIAFSSETSFGNGKVKVIVSQNIHAIRPSITEQPLASAANSTIKGVSRCPDGPRQFSSAQCIAPCAKSCFAGVDLLPTADEGYHDTPLGAPLHQTQ
jgi:hypothetical protein